jgi:hypothetical protein
MREKMTLEKLEMREVLPQETPGLVWVVAISLLRRSMFIVDDIERAVARETDITDITIDLTIGEIRNAIGIHSASFSASFSNYGLLFIK